MKPFIITLLILLFFSSLKGQIQILNTNFDNGVPLGWTQQPAGSWTLSNSFNTPGNCMLTELINSNTSTVSLISPGFDLTAVNNLTVSFKVAITKNNFMNPEFTLGYTTGSATQTLATWAEWFSSTATYTIEGSQDYQYPLDAENVHWQQCTHTISAINAPNASFVFRADIINGGWVLVDSIVIAGIPTNTLGTGIFQNEGKDVMKLFPNPAPAKVTIAGISVKTIQLYDVTGKEIATTFLKTGIETAEVDLSRIPQGIYFIEVRDEKDQFFRKKMVRDSGL